ncbi:HD domain [Arabidopsis suecica]|uniref:HD domain n=1 Tax=Arabidopsis suecica TaxID=45249 RepID=A0A8T2CIC1_ARASU|nr:HD domain [Arabidopsis suecica]
MAAKTMRKAEELVEKAMKGNDASHDSWHVWRVRDLALSIAREEGLSSNSDSMEIVELAALLHDIGDYKYIRDPSEEKLVENFLDEEGIEETKKTKILMIINGMGFKDELAGVALCESLPEFGVVQDADRLDAIGAIGIARCFTFGGSRNRVLHDPEIKPRTELTKEQYIKKEDQTTINHFHEKLLKLKKLMKTEVSLTATLLDTENLFRFECEIEKYQAGRRRAEKRHKFMEEYLKEFYEEWEGST